MGQCFNTSVRSRVYPSVPWMTCRLGLSTPSSDRSEIPLISTLLTTMKVKISKSSTVTREILIILLNMKQ
jgi:hypothetical protein